MKFGEEGELAGEEEVEEDEGDGEDEADEALGEEVEGRGRQRSRGREGVKMRGAWVGPPIAGVLRRGIGCAQWGCESHPAELASVMMFFCRFGAAAGCGRGR